MLNCLYFIPRIEQEIFLHSICRENFFEKIFGIFHFYSYLCSAVPVRPSPRLFDAGDDPGFFVFAKIHNYFDCNNKKAIFLCIFLLSHSSSNIFSKFLASFRRKAYLCSAVPVRPSPRLFDAGDDPGFFIFAARKLNH